MPWPVDPRPSAVRPPVCRPPLSFHIFDISSRIAGDSELLESCRFDIKDGRHCGHLESR